MVAESANSERVVVENKRARHLYAIEERFEAGLALQARR